ncbi:MULTISPECIES: carboxylate-amine ligase [Streptomyces]|uniref:Putative glutamate--cysteine ligase 2 n=1 Tax=Streptomyces sudanensis TaxID=436397 RepID=A0ABY4TL61_9ACTN|nr:MULTISPECIES: glutamate--cysteine ligase [Streptomyces]URN18443.1 glutamate--cysteine ligase [Streptomyces sudanensis]
MTLAVGVEEEFHVLEVETGKLVPRAGEVLQGLPKGRFTTELLQSIVESNSDVHTTLDSLWADLIQSRARLGGSAAGHGLAVVAAGTVPLADDDAGRVTPDRRYRHMMSEYRRIADEQLICGTHVHVDVPDRDTAVRAMCVIAPWVPVLLALSASSPFWEGADTGYASWRTMLWQRWPTAGPAGCFPDAAGYDAAVAELIASGVVTDPGMIYHDLRPSDHQPTLELRVCDSSPSAETVVLVAAVFRALVMRATERVAAGGVPQCDGRHEWLRAATWRAARSGLEGDLIDPVSRRPAPAARVVRAMLTRLRPELEECGDWATVRELSEKALADGSAAHRLRTTAAREDLLACVDELIALTRGPGGRADLGQRVVRTARPGLRRGSVEPIGG